VVAVLTNLVDWLSWVVTLFDEVADEDLDVFLFLDDRTWGSDFFNQVGESATNLFGLGPKDLGIDVGFLGGKGEFVNEGSVKVIVATEESSKGNLIVEFGEGAVSRHTEDDFRDVQVVNVLNVQSVVASFGPFLS